MKNIKSKILTTVWLLAGLTFSAFGQPPVLNSLPGSPNVIYLDFDGEVVEGTLWNSNFNDGNAIEALPSRLNDDEIERAWKQVSEDLRPFNVNVTTSLEIFLNAEISDRVQVIITPSNGWLGNFGGIAYLDSFGSTWSLLNVPCWTFENRIGNSINVGDVCSHEIGHTLDLQHQSRFNSNGSLDEEYHPGKGNGEIDWAPLMGSSYNSNISLWHNGKNPEGNDQDDIAILTEQVPFRADDYGNTSSDAHPLTITSGAVEQTGIITTSVDVDVFSFTANGQVSIAAIPFNVGDNNLKSNLDIALTLRNSAGNVVASSNPADQLDAALSIDVPNGEYFLTIDGVGSVNYTDYGGLGQYTLSGSVEGAAGSFPDPSKWYVLKNRDSGLNMRIKDCNTDAGSFMELTDDTGSCAQFQFVSINGSWHIRNRTAALNIRNDNCNDVDDNTQVELHDGTGSCTRWTVLSAENNYYYLSNNDANLNIRNKDCANSTGTWVELTSDTGNCAQWELIEVGTIEELSLSNNLSTTAASNTTPNEASAADRDVPSALSEVLVYPNPSSGIIQLKRHIEQVQIFNNHGVLLDKELSDNGTIDLSDQPNGLYFIHTNESVFKVVIEE